MFKSKPAKPVQRTKNKKLLRQKAIAFLDKHYTRVKPLEAIPYDFYMLEKRSINGMKKVRCEGKDRDEIKDSDTKMLFNATINYKHFNGTDNKRKTKKIIVDDEILQPIWYRNVSAVGNSASNAVLGGRKTRRR